MPTYALFFVFVAVFRFLPQEELRCRRLEQEVEGLTAKVAAADDHRRRLEVMLKEAKRERDEAAAVSFLLLYVLEERGARPFSMLSIFSRLFFSFLIFARNPCVLAVCVIMVFI